MTRSAAGGWHGVCVCVCVCVYVCIRGREWGARETVSNQVAAAKSLQSCSTLCDPIDGSPPGSPTPGILQAITLEWVAISFSNAWKWKSETEVSQSCPTLSDPPHGLQPTRLLHPWDFPGKSTGVGCHCLLCRDELMTNQAVRQLHHLGRCFSHLHYFLLLPFQKLNTIFSILTVFMIEKTMLVMNIQNKSKQRETKNHLKSHHPKVSTTDTSEMSFPTIFSASISAF